MLAVIVIKCNMAAETIIYFRGVLHWQSPLSSGLTFTHPPRLGLVDSYNSL